VAWPGALLRSQERGDPAVSLWDVAGGKLVHARRLPDYEEIAKFAFSPEGAVVFSHDSLRKLTQWSVATGKSLRTIDLGDNDVYPSTLMDVSADGARAVTLSEYAKRIVLWDVVATNIIRTFDVDASVQAIAISPDGARIAAASQERKVRVWDAANGDLVHTFEVSPAKEPLRYHPVTALAFSPDGAVLAACQGQDDHKHVKLWDVASGKLVRTFDFRCAGSVAVSLDAMHVLARDNVTIGMPEADLKLRLGDTASGQLIHSFDGESAAFARNGRRVFTASYDGTIRIWDAKTGGLIATLLSAVPHDMRWRAKRDERDWLAVTPEGFFDSSSEEFATGMLSIVRGLEVSAVNAAAYQVLHRPDLVRAKLAGDPDGSVEAAAAELQVKLGMK
jgi:WD40 repeat protein